MPLVDLVAGARPNFMKVAPIIRALERHKLEGGTLSYRLIHTGQHYDAMLSGIFFEQLNIPKPQLNLEAGSGSHAEQSARIMTRYEAVLAEQPSDLCLVVGDVTSTMACSITAQKMQVPVAHVEAGIRSGDWKMPEEINRLVTDSISDWFFTTSLSASQNLIKSGISENRIFFVGNTMIDTLLYHQDDVAPPPFWKQLGLRQGQYFVLTLHRPANVDEVANLKRLLRTMSAISRGLPVIFPIHPRTARSFSGIDLGSSCIKLVEPQPYFEFIYLVKNSKAVITDSGGITEEATVLGKPCMTLRDNTERPETIEEGTNVLVGTNPDNLEHWFEKLFAGDWKIGGVPEKWDGKSGTRIIAHLNEILCQ